MTAIAAKLPPPQGDDLYAGSEAPPPASAPETEPHEPETEEAAIPRMRPLVSPLTRRILAVNVLAVALLAVGLLYLDHFRRNLIDTELDALRIQAEISAAAVAEGAVAVDTAELRQLSPERARQMLHRLAEPAKTRARLFTPDGRALVDTQVLSGPEGGVQIEDLAPPPRGGRLGKAFIDLYEFIARQMPADESLPVYREKPEATAADFSEAKLALSGVPAKAARVTPSGRLLLSAAVPIQHYKQVLGALMLAAPGTSIERALREVRINILKIFAVTLAVTVALSLYLAEGIVNPVRRLAAAAEKVRLQHGRHHEIPDFADREDEIGELSVALRDMTEALWRRIDAIEHFAADVSHEIKNPLTSLRSAVETAARIQDPERQRKLMSVIQDDVQRLDRLITDISDASRLDAELQRATLEKVDIRTLIRAMVEIYETSAASDAPRIRYEGNTRPLEVPGLESRLAQVLRNLVANAISFSPKGGIIGLSAKRDGAWAEVTVEDQGPGIPEDKLQAIFDRFYSERPAGEKFGTHSGLGLSISKQIVEAHRGIITAENRVDGQGNVVGARFVLRLPRG